jgi:hypothetical protein
MKKIYCIIRGFFKTNFDCQKIFNTVGSTKLILQTSAFTHVAARRHVRFTRRVPLSGFASVFCGYSARDSERRSRGIWVDYNKWAEDARFWPRGECRRTRRCILDEERGKTLFSFLFFFFLFLFLFLFIFLFLFLSLCGTYVVFFAKLLQKFL